MIFPAETLLLKSRDIKPVIAPDHQLYSLMQDSEVLHALVNISHTLGDLKLHSIPVVDLRKQAEQVPGQENTDCSVCG